MAVAQGPFYEDLGERICLARKTAGFTQQALADKIGLTRTSIVNIEAGRQPIQALQLALVSVVLNTSLEHLIPKVEIPSDMPRNLDEGQKLWIEQILSPDLGGLTNGG